MTPRGAGDDTQVDDTMSEATLPVVDPGGETHDGEAFVAEPLVAEASEGPRYQLRNVIGRGGMGEIVIAHDTQIQREVAVKRMRFRPSEVATARFFREARIQGHLDHPAIVPVHELSVDVTGRPFFVMKRLTGTTMSDILVEPAASASISSMERHSLQRLLRAFCDVCLAVEFAHTKGVVHRDLKPANIMLGDFGEVYVLDWGVARVLGDANDSFASDVESIGGDTGSSAGVSGKAATEAGAVLGTLGYMPPEQARGEAVDHRADIYALGCILFEILAGEPLHQRGSITAVFDEYDARPSRRVPQLDVAPELDALCVAATAPDPAARPSSAREMGERVQRYLDGDRDHAMRRRLAKEQIARARAALVGGDDVPVGVSSLVRRPAGENERRLAMQHAGRALALDPTAKEAAELVGRLMLEPPPEVPRDVVEALDRLDEETVRRNAIPAVVAYTIYLLFVPLIMWVGVDDPLYLGAMIAGVLVNGYLAFDLAHSKRAMSPLRFRLVVFANVALIFVMARMFTPFLIAPGLAVGTLLTVSLHPKFGRTWFLIAAMSAAVVVPWLGEVVGVWPPTISSVDGGILLQPPGGDLKAFEMQIALVAYVVALCTIVGLLARRVVESERSTRRTSYVQAWHLRQLVPSGD
jgi:serine/threonine-protein kinase